MHITAIYESCRCTIEDDIKTGGNDDATFGAKGSTVAPALSVQIRAPYLRGE